MRNKPNKIKIEIKNDILYLIFIILIAAMFTFITINKTKTVGKAIATTCPDGNTIFEISALTNAHTGTWDGSAYTNKVCYTASSGHDCTGANAVIRLSAATNAHVEKKELTTAGYSDVCFGDLTCHYYDGSGTCDSGECLATISANTNAHVGDCGAYTKTICCELPTTVVCPNGFCAYYSFDDGTATDNSDGTNDGIINGATLVTGKVGNALNFDGTNDYVGVADSPSLDIRDAFTIESWVLVEAYPDPTNFKMIVEKEISWGFGIADPNDKLYTAINDGTGWSEYFSTFTPGLNKWYHVAVVRKNDNTLTFYVNGTEVGLVSGVKLPVVNNNPVQIGHEPAASWHYYDGAIDELKIYNYVRTPQQICEDADMRWNNNCIEKPIGPTINYIPYVGFDEDTYNDTNDLDVYVSDADNGDSEISWSYSGNTKINVNINAATHVANLTSAANWTGQETIIFTATDPDSLTDSYEVVVTVHPINDPPNMTRLSNLNLIEDKTYIMNLTANISDVDVGDSVDNLIVYENSSHAAVNGKTITFNYLTPINEDVKITVSDYESNVSQVVSVTVAAVNDAPKFSDGDKTKIFKTTQGGSIAYQFSAADEENDPITYSTNNTLISINPSTGALSYTAPATFLGTFYVEIMASDDKGKNYSLVKSITVDNENFAPTITSFTPEDLETELEAGYEYEFKYTANDPDNDPLSTAWYLNGTLKSTNDTFVYFPSDSDIGKHALILTISDGLLNDSLTWNITVIPKNNAPVLKSNIPNLEWKQNNEKENAFDLDDYFYDPDGNQLVYSFIGLKNISVKINFTDNTVSFTPDSDWHGTEYIIFVADDGNLLVYSNNITLTVKPIGAICGDNVKEGTEECDGTDNSACGVYSCKEDCSCYTPGCSANWQCTDWSNCPVNGQQTRTCTDINRCNTQSGKPEETRSCTYTPTCTDNIKNQNEEGIDCGGLCKACTPGLSPLRRFRWVWFALGILLIATLLTVTVYEVHKKAKREKEKKKEKLMKGEYQHKTLEEQKERELQNYMMVCLNRGFDRKVITQKLVDEKWPLDSINRLFDRVNLHIKAERKKPIVSNLIKKEEGIGELKEKAKKREELFKAFEK